MRKGIVLALVLMLVVVAVSFCILPSRVYAGDAAVLVQTTIDKIRETVIKEKTALSESQMDEKLRAIISPVFDFNEMSRGCLASRWSEATPEQQKEFIDLFSNLLARTYLKKIKDGIEQSIIEIVGEYPKEKTVLVKTTVTKEGDTFALDYRMHSKQGPWRVYDVIIENVGLVGNFRSEFSSIIRKDGMEGLLKKLREKK